MKSDNLSFFNIAFLYVGTVMGAGFASGREGWQFFGIFGSKAYPGIILAGILFMALGMMVSYIARSLGTADIGKILIAEADEKISHIIGLFIAAMLYTVIIPMSAAGGSLLMQEFGIPEYIGGIIVIVLVVATVLGDFDRVSKVFHLVIPVLFVIDVICCLIIIFSDIGQSGSVTGFKPSEMAPTWYISATIFVAYNMIGMIPIISESSLKARSGKDAVTGSGFGGFLLAALTVVLVLAIQKDMAFTDSMDLPMLAYTLNISKGLSYVFAAIIFAAIYSAATSCYYGFTTKLKDGPNKKRIIVIGAAAGFACGLIGFKEIIAYLYPVNGYIGLVVFFLITRNFIKIYRKNHNKGKNIQDNNESSPESHDTDNFLETGEFEGYPGFNRFKYPEGIVRVTAGAGGEALLIFGSVKTAIYDCGMAYCHDGLIKNIENALSERGRKDLDYICCSHTHYDHIGAMPYIIERWPEVTVCAAEKAVKVFQSEGAKKTMKRLGEAAGRRYGCDENIVADGFRTDRVLKDGDIIDLGERYLKVLETPGHTACSLTYVLEPEGIMFTSESTGVMMSEDRFEVTVLKGYDESIASAEKCRAYKPGRIITPHYGMVPEEITEKYFDIYIKAVLSEKEFLRECLKKGMNHGEMMEAYEKEYWSELRGKTQPKEAFTENANHIINMAEKNLNS